MATQNHNPYFDGEPKKKDFDLAIPALAGIASVTAEVTASQEQADAEAEREADLRRNAFAHNMGGGATD